MCIWDHIAITPNLNLSFFHRRPAFRLLFMLVVKPCLQYPDSKTWNFLDSFLSLIFYQSWNPVLIFKIYLHPFFPFYCKNCSSCMPFFSFNGYSLIYLFILGTVVWTRLLLPLSYIPSLLYFSRQGLVLVSCWGSHQVPEASFELAISSCLSLQDSGITGYTITPRC